MKQNKNIKNQELVLPGTLIYEGNDLRTGKGTFKVGNKIYSSIVGVVKRNLKKKIIYVVPLKEPIVLKKNDIVLGEVISVSNSIAQVRIYFVFKDRKFIPLIEPFSGLVHISQLGRRVPVISDFIKVGDRILGKIIVDFYPPYSLSLDSRLLGVVSAKCSICGASLIKKDRRLICPNCERVEQRIISEIYDTEKFDLLFDSLKVKREAGATGGEE